MPFIDADDEDLDEGEPLCPMCGSEGCWYHCDSSNPDWKPAGPFDDPDYRGDGGGEWPHPPTPSQP